MASLQVRHLTPEFGAEIEGLDRHGHAHVLRHEWRNGDLVAWDNLAIQHARSDVRADGPTRTLRTMIAPRSAVQHLETPTFSQVS